MESYSVYALTVILEGANHIFGCHVPQFDCAIFRARSDQTGIRAELGRLYPVRMSIYAEHEFAILQLENF